MADEIQQESASVAQEISSRKRNIFYFCGCIVILGLLAAGGIFYVPKWLNKDKKTTSEVAEKAPATSEVGIKASFKLGKVLPLPLNYFPDNLFFPNLVLGESKPKAAFSKYVLLLKRMQNAYETDINSLLAGTTDREGELNNHLTLLKRLRDDANILLQKLKGDREVFKTELEKSESKRDSFEQGFFRELDVLNPSSGEFLNQFISEAKISLDLKARFKAFEKIIQLYESAIPKFDARIRDIELNKEPLVKGIKVFDIEDSDIKLILPVETKAL